MHLRRFHICLACCAFCLSSRAQSGSITYHNNGQFVVPSGVTSISVEVLGRGGRGGFNGGGGGGGGGFAKGAYQVTPNSTLQVVVDHSVSALYPLIYATAGKNGQTGNTFNFTAVGGQGGIGFGGNIVNSSGGNGGEGWPGYFGGGGGGGAGINGNAENGENAPTYISYTGLYAPVAKGGASGGGVAGNGGSGGGYKLSKYSYSVDVIPTHGLGFGSGGGGGNTTANPAWGSGGYCFISWGNTCKTVDPYTESFFMYDPRFCISKSNTIQAVGYDTLEWYKDTLLSPFAKGKVVMSPVLTNTLEIYYVKSGLCPQNNFVPLHVTPCPSINTVPAFQYTTLCWGDKCFVAPSGCISFEILPVAGYPPYSWYFYNTLNVTKDSTINLKVVGYSQNLGCPDTADFQVLVHPPLEFSCTASSEYFCRGDSVVLNAFGPAIKTYSWMTGEAAQQIKVKPEHNYRNYVAMGYDSLGCGVTRSIELTDKTPFLSIVVDEDAGTRCRGDSVLCTVLGAATYTWSSGQTTNPVWLSTETTTSYTVTGIAFGCSATATCNLKVADCTGLPEQQEKDLLFFPNPTAGRITVMGDGAAEISLSDLHGNCLKTFSLSALEAESLNLDVAPGIYFLSLSKGPKRKLIVTCEPP